ncbi:hypothetical protein CL635_01135 [bacterium]|jgi:hypothetical protein|nr:hypothetical protein [bacterium]|tara:strand:+ start:2079 stop:2549 length:471 start_codon:yes stop_codon:yes gene_type:complete
MSNSESQRNRSFLGVSGVTPFGYPSFLDKEDSKNDLQQIVNFSQLGVNAILRERSGGDSNGMSHFLRDAGSTLQKLRTKFPKEGGALEDLILDLIKTLVKDFNTDNSTAFDVDLLAQELANVIAAGAFWYDDKEESAQDVHRIIGQHRNDLPDYLL